LRLLAGRLGDDFKAGLQRIVALDQMQRGFAAAEQFDEQPPWTVEDSSALYMIDRWGTG